MTETMVATKIHIVESKENQVTLCTKEPYKHPELPETRLVELCSVCWGEVKKERIADERRERARTIQIPPYLADPH